jgi:hypothetical protein
MDCFNLGDDIRHQIAGGGNTVDKYFKLKEETIHTIKTHSPGIVFSYPH